MNREDYLVLHTKQDPEKYCAYCGKRMHRARFDSGRLEDLSAFTRRKYCCRECMRKAFVKIGVTEQTYRGAHKTAEHIAYSILGKPHYCERCGSAENIDVHHKDGNYNNNIPENLVVLCRSCHIKEHREKGICKICGAPVKGNGFCNKHLIRYRKYGNPLMCYNKIIDE